MAVTPPVPPVPPVAPVAPAVSLGDGGSSHEVAAPQGGHTTGEEQQESQARAAVANGEGALGKTTVSDPKAQNAQDGQSNGQAMGTTQATKRSSTQLVQDGQVQQALADGSQQQGQQDAQTGQKSQTGEPPVPKSYTNYSTIFWGVTAVFLVAFAAFLVKQVLLRKQDAEGLDLKELFHMPGSRRRGEAEPMSERTQEKPQKRAQRQEEILTEYTGMRPDEVLAKLSREAVVPKKNLTAYKAQKPAGEKSEKKPKAPSKKPVAAKPPTAVPGKGPQKPAKTSKRKGKADDAPHFEARV